MARKADRNMLEDYHENGPCGAKVSHVINSREFDVDYCPGCNIFIYKNRKSEDMEVGAEFIPTMGKQIEIEHGKNPERVILKYLRNLPANKSDEKRRQKPFSYARM